ncbi:hypothetical protein TNCV_1234471 [Trichonephila clavipes]|nr:hypothetical protein TNCV_1234471 [Trichonephila clavipes]
MVLKDCQVSPVLPMSCTRYTPNHQMTGSVFTLAYLLYGSRVTPSNDWKSSGDYSNIHLDELIPIDGSPGPRNEGLQVRARFQIFRHPGSSPVSSLPGKLRVFTAGHGKARQGRMLPLRQSKPDCEISSLHRGYKALRTNQMH